MSSKIPRINFFTFVSRSREKVGNQKVPETIFFLKKAAGIQIWFSAADWSENPPPTYCSDIFTAGG